ncbi:glycosyltransferase family 2 protein [Siminovitchia sediminis]|uniref:Glycosyltransferase family 2 protein n=1 Tax=Siminovitchia sediminis TaxID=1274353 RepID=A0ABW4KKG9_9BACI
MTKTKVSVIVPIYKVEKYIHRCVESIIGQSYWNLDIILVNDGSPDQCGSIIEEYAKKDSRIIVVHKENGGLSDARNAGMECVTGDYVMFVDSDDWIANNMVEQLLNMIIYCRADVVQSAFYYAYNDYLLYDNRCYSKDESPILHSNQSLMQELLKNETVKNFAWGKLYKASIIKDIPFKKNVLFEDVFWAHQVMKRVKNFVIMHEPLYYYYQRENSIVSNYSLKNLDFLKGLKERHTFIEQHYKELADDSYRSILKACLIHYNLLFLNKSQDQSGQYKNAIRDYIMQHFSFFQEAAKSDKELRRQLELFSIHPMINVAFLGARKLARRLKLIPTEEGLEKVNLRI